MGLGFFIRTLLIPICFILSFSACDPKQHPFEKSTPSVSVVFTGDVMLDRGIRKQIEQIGVEALFDGVSSIFKQSDYTVINLECPVTDTVRPRDKPYVFRAEPEWLSLIRQAGVTHACLANNHSIDQDEGGLLSSVDNLNRCGIVPFGAGPADSSACSPVFFIKSGIAFSLFGSAPLFLEYRTIDAKRAVPCIRSSEQMAERIRLEKRTRPGNKILTFLHWGKEYEEKPSRHQQEEARLLVDAGADAVIGHHPHVLQPVEIYQNKPIFYSLGNLIFDQRDPATQKGMVVRMVFCPDSVKSVELFPVVIERGIPRWVSETDPGVPEIILPDSGVKVVIRYKIQERI